MDNSTKQKHRPPILILPDLTEEQIRRFWSKVDKNSDNECWLWLGTRNRRGYGIFAVRHWPYIAHRLSFLMNGGVFTAEQPCGLHSCHNPPCVNPAHIRAGTNAENSADAVAAGRQAHGDWFSAIRRATACRGDNHPSRLRPERRPRGSKSKSSKLTESQVAEMREAYALGNCTQRELANRYGVSQGCIGFILRGEFWRHV